MNEETKILIRRQVIAAYHDRYHSSRCRIPDMILDGLLVSLLYGEVQLQTDMPIHWPLSVIAPLLQQAIIQTCPTEEGLVSV
jgi:hypothetical protein